MSEQKELKFVEGMWVSRKETAPEYVVAKLSFSFDTFIEFMTKNVNNKGYVKIDIKKSKSGNLYAVVDDFVPTKQ